MERVCTKCGESPRPMSQKFLNANGLCTDCDRPHKFVRFVAIAPYYWGRGDTEEEAIAQLRAAGWRRGKGKVRMLEFRPGTEDAHVDGFGAPSWWTAPGAEDGIGYTGRDYKAPRKVKQ